jgi:hypothetical protein
MREQFEKALTNLERRLKSFKGRADHQVPDLVFLNMLIDVLEHAKAVSLLVDSQVPRAAYGCARASLEAAQDLLLMASDASKYDESGALARAFEVAEIEELHRRRERADQAIGISTNIPMAPGRDVLDEDAKEWDKAAPGKGRLLLEAYDQVRKDNRRHWSNMSRKNIAEEIARRAPSGSGLAEMSDALYGLLSIHTHPRPRTGMREFLQTAPDRYAVKGRDFDREGPLGLTYGAMTMATGADEMRLLIK